MERNSIATPLKGGGKKGSENNLGGLKLDEVTKNQSGIKKGKVCLLKNTEGKKRTVGPFSNRSP